MNEQSIVFDVDGCLISIEDDSPREEVINLMRAFNALGWKIYVHSGGSVPYAERVVRRLGLDKEMHITIAPKGSPDYSYNIAVDDAIDNEVCNEQKISRYIKTKLFIKV